jgi:hypothetical protein
MTGTNVKDSDECPVEWITYKVPGWLQYTMENVAGVKTGRPSGFRSRSA